MQTELTISGRRFDEERALYALRGTLVRDCDFSGPADGESALKECHDIDVDRCRFSLRYPLWHAKRFSLHECTMDEQTRAPIWYAEGGLITDCTLNGPKCLRECRQVIIEHSRICSAEFGWKCSDLTLRSCELESEYAFLDSRDLEITGLRLKGKYSFQYVHDTVIRDSVLDTKDAFWHSRNVRVENCEVRGEYLGWFSEGLTLVGCRIAGTQPLCYCKSLRLEDCTMEGCDLSFEYSEVEATVQGHIDSVKNPLAGHIIADSVGAVIREEPVMPCTGQVELRERT